MTDPQRDDHLILMIDVMNVVRKVIMLMTVIATVVGEEAGIFVTISDFSTVNHGFC